MASFLVKLGAGIFRLEDLGPAMNTQFMKLYESHFGNHALDLNNFKTEAFNFFSQNDGNYGIHNYFFSNFAQIWITFLEHGAYREAERIWDITLQIAYEWEKANPGKRVHKGTPYYFWGVTCILNEDLEKGFLLMHQALTEDRLTQATGILRTPAFSFVTLDYENQNQYFKQKVGDIASFIDGKLATYRSTRGGTLSLSEFRQRFLENSNLHEAVFYFVFTSFRLKRLSAEINPKLTQNVFSSLLEANLIFDLCLILDGAIKNKNQSQWMFIDHMVYVSSRASLKFDRSKLGDEINVAFKSDFQGTLQKILLSQFKFRDTSTMTSIEEDLAIAYGFRNFGAHRIEDAPVIYQNFEKISDRILNALFFCVEKVYI